MINIEELLKLPYETLKDNIINKKPHMLEALKDKRLKEKLINSENKYDFIWLVQELPDEYANQLFDEEGIKLLIQTPDLIPKMNGILTCNKPYLNKLFENKDFCKLVADNLDRLDSYLYNIKPKGALKFIKYIQENEPEKLKKVLVNLSKTTQEEVVKEIKLPDKLLVFCITHLHDKAAEYLVNNDERITSLKDCSFDQLHAIFSKKFTLKPSLLEDRIFIKKIVSMSDVKDYRFLINELSKANNVDEIEKLRKDFYTSELISYNPEFKMLEKYCKCYQELCKLIDSNYLDSTKANEVIDKCFNFFGNETTKYNISKKILNKLKARDKEGLKDFFVEESNLQMSNMIIDCHFEEIPYNFFLDVEQLCHFQQKEGRTLNDDDLSIYQKLLNIDKLSYEDKLLLHHKLSNDDWISKNYDVFRAAKDKAAMLIKEQMLNQNNVYNYYNLKITQETGVPIYELAGDEFFALVKALRVSKERPLNNEDIKYYVDGSSYSLDGSNKLSTFLNPREYYNLIYSDFPVEQVVHMYPVDSFSKYDRNYSTIATHRIYELYTPTELLGKSSDYNEIIIAQQNQKRKNDELNDNLKVPKILGIYCYDEITPNDITSAKNLGVGIVLIKTKNYNINRENRMELFDTISSDLNQRYRQKIDYLTDVKSDDMINRRTK